MARVANQFTRIAAGDVQHFFRLCAHEHNPAVLGLQKVAPAQNMTAVQKQPDLFAVGQCCTKTAFLPQLKRQNQFDIVSQLLRQAFRYHQHDQNKKYRCAIGSVVAGSHIRSSPSART